MQSPRGGPTMDRRPAERLPSAVGPGSPVYANARQQQSSSPVTERRGASDTFRDAKGASAQLKAMLKERTPWSTDVDFTRQKARNFYIATIFSHPLSTYAQTLDPLWLDTSYSLIGAYREAVAKVESRIAVHGPNARSGSRDSGPVELRKVLTRFRQALASEETFYRGLITRIVAFFKLQSHTYPFLNLVAIPVPQETGGGVEQGLAPDMSMEDTLKKLALVHKGLICLGDIERYKEQYSEKQRRAGRETASKDRFAKAQTFYEVARGLLPDNGAPSNQLAVISTYIPDGFLCIYHYYRSLAVPQPFPGAEANLDRALKRAFDRWRAERHNEANPEEAAALSPEAQFKKDFVIILAVLTLRASTSHMPTLTATSLQTFRDLLAARQMPSEIIVKSIVMAIGAHWQARLCQQTSDDNDAARAAKKADTEALALDFLLGLATVLLELASQEISDGLTDEALESLQGPSKLSEFAVVDDEDDFDHSRATRRRGASGEGRSMASSVAEAPSSFGSASPTASARHLAQSITAVMRRFLPSLRIFSKWIKSNLEYLIRAAASPASTALAAQLQHFWSAYCRYLNLSQTAFPIGRLPSLNEPLEEDIDMRGFTPLKRGIMEPVGRSDSSAELREEPKDVHPNEEQLMRIGDLLVDGKLLAQAERAGIAVAHERFVLREVESLTAQALQAPPFAPTQTIRTTQHDEEHELASVSTETEDDPVNLAMRATMADGSSVDGEEVREADDDEDDEEQIVWQRRTTVTGPSPFGVFGSPQRVEQSTSARGFSRTNTAQDLLSNLVLNTPRAPLTPTTASSKLTSPPGPSPSLLFGGDALSGSGNIWSVGGDQDTIGRAQSKSWNAEPVKQEAPSFGGHHPVQPQQQQQPHPNHQRSPMSGPPSGFQPSPQPNYVPGPLEAPSVPPPMPAHYGHAPPPGMHPHNPQLYPGFAPGPFDTQYGIGQYPQQHFESWSQQQPPPNMIARSNSHFGPQDQPGYWG